MIDLQWNRDFALEQAGEDEELLGELLVLLQESTANDLAKIKAGLKKGDAKIMGEAAHSIKGAAASLGVEKLRVLARDLEKAGLGNDLGSASDLVPFLEDLVSSISTLK
ncbi:MAG: Hpt domain-containing protein [Thermodesulfobacteriota bacterium]